MGLFLRQKDLKRIDELVNSLITDKREETSNIIANVLSADEGWELIVKGTKLPKLDFPDGEFPSTSFSGHIFRRRKKYLERKVYSEINRVNRGWFISIMIELEMRLSITFSKDVKDKIFNVCQLIISEHNKART